MKIEDILSRFEGVEQQSPDSWMARCPAHGDNNPSLSITRKPDGKVLMHCFTGCTKVALLPELAKLLPVFLIKILSSAVKPCKRCFVGSLCLTCTQ